MRIDKELPMIKRFLTVVTAAGLALTLAACEEGPLEKAGKSIDKAGEKAGDKIKDATK